MCALWTDLSTTWALMLFTQLGTVTQTNLHPSWQHRHPVVDRRWKLARNEASLPSVNLTESAVILAVIFLLDWTSMC
jgi:hypothetical protein